MTTEVERAVHAAIEPETDYVAIAIAYAEEAIEDKRGKWSCRWVRLAARRFLRDLERSLGARPPFLFSAKHANAHCAFIEKLPHIEGDWSTPENPHNLIVLEPAQIFFVVQLFGFRALKGGRRFTEALFAVARKNAKSTLAAAIMLSAYCLERENGPQLITAATTGSQARIVFDMARKMVNKSSGLRDRYDLEVFSNAITRAEVGGQMKPINSKASTQDGLNPTFVELDEIHAHKSPDLLNVLRSAAGGRRAPLFMYTTTEGYESPGPWPEIRNFAKQVLQRLFKADHFLAIIYALDDNDPEGSEFDPRKWIKANPLLEVNPFLFEELKKLAVNARAMPSAHGEFLIKRCNRPAAAAAAWVNLYKWRKCGGEVDLDRLAGVPCWGALDLASTTDMVAWRLLWQLGGYWYTWGRYWVPEDAVRLRTESRSVPYAGWVKAGHIIQTPGDTHDYDRIQLQILEDYQRFQPQKIAFDPWNAQATVNALMNDGLPMEAFIQGPKSFNPAMKSCEVAYTSGRLRHGGNPVLTWNAANVVARKDANLNEAPDRKRSPEKIDGMVCLFMCFGLAGVDDMEAFAKALANPVSV